MAIKLRKWNSAEHLKTEDDMQAYLQECIVLQQSPPSKKQNISSKSFGQRVTKLDSLKDVVSVYLQSAVKQLREDNSLCGCVIAFDKERPFYNKSISIGFFEPTDSAAVMIKAVMKRIDEVFKE